jgi:tetratricopeptide (TPR) repeat protein
LHRALRAHREGDLAKAERLYSAALQQQPDYFDALHGLGQIHYQCGRLDSALALIQTALQHDLTRADGYASLGIVFHSLKQFERARISYEEGLRLKPNDPELINRHGVALLELGRPRAALEDFDRLLTGNPNHFEALGNRANALLKLNRADDALAAYDRALALAPDNPQLLTNRAVALRRLDRPHEALMCTRKALAVASDFAPARFVESMVRLTLGDFAGWRDYEARWLVGFLAAQRRTFAVPLWLGTPPLAGKTVLLHSEQGFGDTIQFVRYAPLVAARGAAVILQVQAQLVRLLSSMPGVTAVIANGAPLPKFDLHCPLLSLPLACGTELATIPVSIPYVAAADIDFARWQARLPQGRRRIGLVWAGERTHDNDLNRSMRLATLAPLFDLPDVTFISLQHEVRDEDADVLRAHPQVLPIGAEFRDFADTAAAIAALDGVIAVDTAVAHLAGALGKPLFLLLPFAADFRWLRERGDSPWYPSARLLRQPAFGDWASVVEALRYELTRFAAEPDCSSGNTPRRLQG